jgi:hypothetical protein
VRRHTNTDRCQLSTGGPVCRAARFRLQVLVLPAPVAVVKRPSTRALLIVLLLVSCAAAWFWLRPYSWNPDPAARFRIENARLTPDQEYRWLDLHLKRTGDLDHDLQKPIRLHTSTGRLIEPADITLAYDGGAPPSELWLKFWLESGDLNGPLELRINDGTLVVKSSTTAPVLDADHSAAKVYSSPNW